MIDDAGSHLCTNLNDEMEQVTSIKGGNLDGDRESPTDVVAAVNAPLEALREDGKQK